MKLPRIGTEMSLTQRAYETIRDAILNKVLAPNEVFYEVQVADQLGVSRTPLRAALQRLEYEHLIKSLPGKGYKVASLNRKDMEHVFFMRKLLEPAAARLAAQHRTDKDVARIKEAVKRQEQALSTGDYLEYLQGDRQFHLAIAAATQNPYLRSVCTTVQLHGFRFLVLDEFVRERANTSVQEHLDIALCLEKGDAEGTARGVTDHIIRTEAMLASVLQDGG